jgi:hypothetical protein
VELSPFTVNSDRDRGFVAASSLAGGRLSTDLKDTPVAYSVLTRDFIEALNITNLTMAQQWTTGFNEIEDDGRQNQFGDGERGRRTFRGVSSNQQQIEFFPAYYDYDSYNLERFDSPAAPTPSFSAAAPWGAQPTACSSAPTRERRRARLPWPSAPGTAFRATVDLNRPITPKLAVRFNGLWEDSNTWRDVEYYNRRAATLTSTYRPWTGGNFRVTAEVGENHRNASLTGMGDRVSGWDGVTTFTGRQAAAPPDANARGVGFFGVNNFIFSPGLMGSAIVDWNGHANTQGGNASAAVPIGGQLVVGPLANYTAAPLLGATNRPDNAFVNVLRGAPKFFIPPRTASTTLGGDTWMTQFDNIHLGFDQQLGKHFFLGLSGNYSYSIVRTHFTVARGLNDVYIDINRLLPTGEANPNFLTPYSESTHDFDHVTRRSRNARGNIAAVFDDTRFGSFRFNLERVSPTPIFPASSFVSGCRIPMSLPAIGSMSSPASVTTGAAPSISRARHLHRHHSRHRCHPHHPGRLCDRRRSAQRHDLGRRCIRLRPSRARRQVLQGAPQPLAAIRRDDYESVTDQMVLRGDQPNGWDGVKVHFRPRPPRTISR